MSAANDFYARAARDNITVVGTYSTSRIPVEIICPKGHRTTIRPTCIQQGQGWCGICAQAGICEGNRSKAAKRFIDRAATAGVTLLGNYVDSKTGVDAICPEGHPCKPRPGAVKDGINWCERCSQLVGAEKRAQGTKEKFLTAAKEAGVTLLEEYKNSHTPVRALCPKGHACAPRADSMDRLGWCNRCGIQRTEKFIPLTPIGNLIYQRMVQLELFMPDIAMVVDVGESTVGAWLREAHPRMKYTTLLAQALQLPEVEVRKAIQDTPVKGSRTVPGGRSGYFGVQRRGDKWGARLNTGEGERLWLGTYPLAVEAARAYDEKVVELGLTLSLNFPRA